MSKKLEWKAFEVHEEQAAFVQSRHDALSVEQRIKRFFEVWDMLRALKKSDYKPEGFVLKKSK